MIKEKILKRPMISFVILSYIIFLGLFTLTGISMSLEMPGRITELLKIISAWSSTFAFLFLFKKIYPGVRLKEFVKEKFAQKLKLSVVALIISIQTLIYIATIVLLSSTNNILGITTIFTGVTGTIYLFIWHLLWGPLGEQLGWRGYMLNELQKKHSPLVAALIKGTLWGLWHAPLWLVSGFNGVSLIKYCLLFMISLVSVSIVITFFYKINNNLLIPIIIHQLFNFFTYSIIGESLDFIMYTALLYFIAAMIIVIINPRGILYQSKKLKKSIII